MCLSLSFHAKAGQRYENEVGYITTKPYTRL
jgi:hypothetical protein